MPHITLTINGDTIIDGDIGQWTTEPPALTNLKAKAVSEPWAIPIMQTIAHAVIHQQHTTITATTRNGGGWTLDVEPAGA